MLISPLLNDIFTHDVPYGWAQLLLFLALRRRCTSYATLDRWSIANIKTLDD